MNVLGIVLALCGVAYADKYCPEPDIPYGGYEADALYENFEPGSKVKFYCDPGYSLKPPRAKLATCGYNYKWKPRVPKCVKRVKCPAPEKPYNGGYNPEQDFYTNGQKIVYYCEYGFELKPGAYKTRKCMKNGKWDKPAPECIKKIIYCPTPSEIEYGTFDPNQVQYTYPDKVSYSCNVGFYLEGAETFTCQRDGTWDPQPFPVCKRKCKMPKKPDNGGYEPEQKYYMPGEMVLYECDDYYHLKGEEKLTCQEGGGWDFPAPECRQKTCPSRLAPEWGGLKPDLPFYVPGGEITFFCINGYVLKGSGGDRCGYDGEWEINEDPICVKQCQVDYEIENGSHSPEKSYYNPGEHITFECFKGYCLGGQAKFTCQKSGEWDPKDWPVCGLQCSLPSVPYGGVIKEKPYYCPGEYIKYYCKRGYTNEGDKEARCQSYGSWNGKADCKRVAKKCSKPKIKFGGVDPEQPWYGAGTLVNFYCNRGYILIGSTQGECLSSGEWSSIPSCDRDRKKYSCKDRCGVLDYGGYTCQCHYTCQWTKKPTCCDDYYDYCDNYEVAWP